MSYDLLLSACDFFVAKRRYTSSKENLIKLFQGKPRLDLNKFFLNEGRERRKPHVVTYEEEDKILAVARPRIRVLTVLGIETGMRTGEMLNLKWKDVDLVNDVIHVEKSKTAYGVRSVPISDRCKMELIRWRNLLGPEYSEWVFPNFENRRHRLQGGRKAWVATLKKAGLEFFPIYYLRHTFASRLTTAGDQGIRLRRKQPHPLAPVRRNTLSFRASAGRAW